MKSAVFQAEIDEVFDCRYDASPHSLRAVTAYWIHGICIDWHYSLVWERWA